MGVDYEQRVDFDRLRALPAGPGAGRARGQRLRRVPAVRLLQHPLHHPDLDRRRARRQDDPLRAARPATASPMLWDFGSAARHHQLYSPWLGPENCRAGHARPARRDRAARRADGATRSARSRAAGRGRAWPTRRSASTSSSRRSCSRCSGRACTSSTPSSSCSTPGRSSRRTRSCCSPRRPRWSTASTRTSSRRSSPASARTRSSRWPTSGSTRWARTRSRPINAVSGERCNPHPHNFSDRLIRPGDQAFFDIIHSYNGYRTCYYRTFSVGSATPSQRDAYTKAREWMDAAIDGDQARRRHRRDRRGAGRRPTEFGFAERDGRLRPAVRRTASAWACTSGRSSPGSTA